MEGSYTALQDDDEERARQNQQSTSSEVRGSRSGSMPKGIKSVHDIIRTTKDWIFSDDQPSRRERRERGEEDSYDNLGEEAQLGSISLQQDIPVVFGEEIQPSSERRYDIYKSLTIYPPPGVSTEEIFTVALPTGENRSLVVPLASMNAPILVCYPLIEEEVGQVHDSIEDEEERLLKLYRVHRPVEREAVLMKGEHGFGLGTYDGEFGLHIRYAVFSGVENMIIADDIIVSINGQQVSSQEEMKRITANVDIGDAITLGILRKSPALTLKCPKGRVLRKVTLKDSIEPDLSCRRCNEGVWNLPVVYNCEECSWTLCNKCFKILNEKYFSEENANAIIPTWANQYEESLGKNLQNSFEDIGKKIRIYSHFTGEWWLGEISDYDSQKGHTIIYEEGDKLSKEVISDISTREYRLLQAKSKDSAQEPSQEQAEEVSNTLVQDRIESLI